MIEPPRLCTHAVPLFVSQMMFGILYAASPEVFPAKHRGTGNGLTATAARVFGVLVRLFSDTPLIFLPPY
jgi:hypothetical protein